MLGTVSAAGTAQSALVGIAITRDLEIVFDTVKSSRKYPNLILKPPCSFVIVWDSVRTVQYERTAWERRTWPLPRVPPISPPPRVRRTGHRSFPPWWQKLGPEGALVYATTFSVRVLQRRETHSGGHYRSALLASNVRILKVAPKGSSLTRTASPSSTPAPWVLPRSTGGFQYVGTAASGIPVTADAVQTFADQRLLAAGGWPRGHPLGATVSGVPGGHGCHG